MTKTAQLISALAMVEAASDETIKVAWLGQALRVAKPLLKGFGKAIKGGLLGAKSSWQGMRAGTAGMLSNKLTGGAKTMAQGKYLNFLKGRSNTDAARTALSKGLSGRELQGFNAAGKIKKRGLQGLSAYYGLDYMRQIFKNENLKAQVGQYEDDFRALQDTPVDGRLSYLFNKDPRSLYR